MNMPNVQKSNLGDSGIVEVVVPTSFIPLDVYFVSAAFKSCNMRCPNPVKSPNHKASTGADEN